MPVLARRLTPRRVAAPLGVALALGGLVALPPAATAAEPVAEPGVVTLAINEVESSGGVPGDWVELVNTGTAPVDAAGLVLRDNDDAHAFTVPAGTVVAPGAFWVADVDPDFGLGASDQARLFAADGTTLLDSFSWTSHAATTYGRCPDGTGAFRVTSSVTRGAANDCSSPVRINEVESSGGTPGDWVELVNPSALPVDVSGYVVKDDDDTHALTVPAGTSIPAGGSWVVEVEAAFGLGGSDSARLFDATGALVDSFSWASHAATSYGRCPDATGAFTTTTAVTKGAANDCGVVVPAGLRINEVESSGGTPGDWVELVNTGSAPVDAGGLRLKDNDDTHAFSVVPAGTTIPAGGSYVVEEAALGFGLGSADSARLFAADGSTLIDSYTWTAHATTTYGRCPDGTGAFRTTTSPTKGAANDCSSPVRINEVESSGGTPGDWVEFVNAGSTPADVSGWTVKDNDDTHALVIPAGTSIAAGGYWVAEVEASFGLGGADSARLYDATGALVDSFAWTAHASTTYGRCPDASGAFGTTLAVTKGATNLCPGDLVTSPWPGGDAVRTVDPAGVLGGNISGLVYQGGDRSGRGTLWAVQNGPGTLFQLVWDGAQWVPAAGEWAAGKPLRFPDGTGDVDAEGVTVGPDGALYVSVERDNSASGVSRLGVLRVDPSAPGAELVASTEWPLVADLPPVGANAGLEAITWVPDAYLVEHGFRDERTGGAYDPAAYPGHGSGLYLVGLEANGAVYAYALASDGTYAKVATVTSGFTGVMDLSFDPERQQVWVVCDDTCRGRSAVMSVATSGDSAGSFVIDAYYERPASAPNLNNEGFALASQRECVAGQKPVWWSDDSATDGFALREGTVDCTPLPVVDPEITAAVAGARNAAGWYRAATVTFTCTEHSAPLTGPCPAPVVLGDGADQVVTRTVSAVDGGTASVEVTDLDVDGAVPTVAVTGVAAGAVYLGVAPSPSCAASDATSGVATCALATTRSGERVTVTARAVDRAGNAASATVAYRVLSTYVQGATYRDGVFEVKAGGRYTVVTPRGPLPLLAGPLGLPVTSPLVQLMRPATIAGQAVSTAPVVVSRKARVGQTGVAVVTNGRSIGTLVLRVVR